MSSAAAVLSAPQAQAKGANRLPRELVVLALTLMLGAIMVGLDSTMVNVALNTLATDFHTSLATIQWVSTSYLLALATVIPLSAWASERFGARNTWIASVMLFTVGSVLCGLAWSAGSLIAFRVLQGLGGGLIVPLMQSVLARAAGPARLPRVMAAIGVPAMLAPVLGPALGGLLVGASWRLIFYINVPICMLALIATRRVAFPATRTTTTSRLDVRGLALLSPSIAAIVYGLSQAGTHGTFTDRRVLIPALAGAALLGVFAVHALRTRVQPIVDLRLFRTRSFTGATLVIFFFGMAMLGTLLLLPLYYQQARGEDALHAGLLLAPQGLGFGLALIAASRLSGKVGPRWLVLAGLALTAASMLALTRIGDDTSLLLPAAASFVAGLGIGAAIVPAMTGAYRDLPQEAIARATSSIRILQQLGGSLGIAILAVVLQQQIGHLAGASLASAFAHTYWLALGFAVLALLPALLLPRTPVADQPPAEA
jgi:EmrB/QacA subfamily drug resistance transporter